MGILKRLRMSFGNGTTFLRKKTSQVTKNVIQAFVAHSKFSTASSSLKKGHSTPSGSYNYILGELSSDSGNIECYPAQPPPN
jgi:hypothetical protein